MTTMTGYDDTREREARHPRTLELHHHGGGGGGGGCYRRSGVRQLRNTSGFAATDKRLPTVITTGPEIRSQSLPHRVNHILRRPVAADRRGDDVPTNVTISPL
ncbi:Uncharacterized protein FWK35_00012216 [Aphis craccivora]|uniref:Uncharacterized protein n=1 Tax=Aphis craccivora TaxID=307492 RepID=A0A6G0ZK74_APHCR|nr:Uncharacterized protein FWK35_00012216 [Aphis craccivora]